MRVIRTVGSHPFFRVVERPRYHNHLSVGCTRPKEYFSHDHHHRHHQHNNNYHYEQNPQQQQKQQQPQQPSEPQYYNRGFYDLTEEFDRLHRDFFNGFPMRRYVHSDLFRRLDDQFAREFYRFNSQKQAKNAETGSTQQTSKNEATENKKETATQKNNQQQDELDLHPFFRSPFHLRNLESTFEEESSRLQKMIEEFENRLNSNDKQDPAKYRIIRENYRSSPEGYVHEYSDSQNPKHNFNIDTRKKQDLPEDLPTQTATENLQKQNNQNTAKPNTTQSVSSKENVVHTQKSTVAEQPPTVVTPTQAQTQQAEPVKVVEEKPVVAAATNTNTTANKTDGRIEISPELNQKAKQLSIMLNKDYMEALELARVYKNKSVGQIIDLVLSSQQEQTY